MKTTLSLSVLVLFFSVACSDSGQAPPSTAGGAGGSGGGGAGGGNTMAPAPVDAVGLPIPTGASVPRPAGAPGNLTVLDWAGFKAAVSWTFDDGQPSQIAHYAELQAAGAPMTFYLTSNGGGGANFDATWTQAVKDGHELGNHSVHHCQADLTGCTSGSAAASLDAELDGCTTFITQHYPAQGGIFTFAAPFGDGGYAKPAATRFLLNRGVSSGLIGAGIADKTDRFNLPSRMVTQGETATVFNAATDSARSAGKWLVFLVHTITPTDASWYAPVATTDVTAAMVYGRTQGDVWMGTMANVAAYWVGQKLLMAATPTVAGTDTTWSWTLPVGFPPGKYLRVRVDGGTLTQAGTPLDWDEHGYYAVSLDAGAVTLSP